MKNIYIGVDGGGTKSKVRVEDEEGNLLSEGLGGPANLGLSVDQAWDSVHTTIDKALAAANLSLQDQNYLYHAGMGLAGCEVQSAYQEFINRPQPFSTFTVISDAHAACVGAHELHDGCIIIIGTGVVGFQLERNEIAKVGGWGFPHDDEGGGAWLGLEAVRLTLKWQDRRIKISGLLEEVFAHFNHDITHMVTWAHKAKSTDFGKLAPFVVKHFQKNDEWAVELMHRAAKFIDQIGDALVTLQHQEKPLPCSLFGGISPFLKPLLGKGLQERIITRHHDATSGAILVVKEKQKKCQQSA